MNEVEYYSLIPNGPNSLSWVGVLILTLSPSQYHFPHVRETASQYYSLLLLYIHMLNVLNAHIIAPTMSQLYIQWLAIHCSILWRL